MGGWNASCVASQASGNGSKGTPGPRHSGLCSGEPFTPSERVQSGLLARHRNSGATMSVVPGKRTGPVKGQADTAGADIATVPRKRAKRRTDKAWSPESG